MFPLEEEEFFIHVYASMESAGGEAERFMLETEGRN